MLTKLIAIKLSPAGRWQHKKSSAHDTQNSRRSQARVDVVHGRQATDRGRTSAT